MKTGKFINPLRAVNSGIVLNLENLSPILVRHGSDASEKEFQRSSVESYDKSRPQKNRLIGRFFSPTR
jgi:hypothetical protein